MTTTTEARGCHVPLQVPCVYFVPNFFTETEATELYTALLQSTKWETTTKINRWVALYEDEPSGYRYRDAPPPSSDDNTTMQQQQAQRFRETVQRVQQKVQEWYSTQYPSIARRTTTTTTGNEQKKNSSKENTTTNGSPILSSTSELPTEEEGENVVQPQDNTSQEKSSIPNNQQDGTTANFNVCLLNFYQDGHQRIGWHCDREEIGRTTPIISLSFGAEREFHIRSQTVPTDRTIVNLTHGSLILMDNICQHTYLHSIPHQPSVTTGRINLTFRCKHETTPGERNHQQRDEWHATISKFGNTNGTDPPPSENPMTTWENEDNMNGPWTPMRLFGHDDTGTDQDTTYDDSKVGFTVSCNLGTERYTAAEIRERIDPTLWKVIPKPWNIPGYVACVRRKQINETTDQEAMVELLQLRSAWNVMKHHDHFTISSIIPNDDNNSINKTNDDNGNDNKVTNPKPNVPKMTAEDLYQFYKQRLVDKKATISTLPPPENETNTKITFRVTCHRIGDHPFQTPQVEREMGGAMMEYYTNAKPQMNDYDVHVRVDIVGDDVILGTQCNVDDLSKRRQGLQFRNGVSIKCNLAYVMLRLADIRPDQILVDPFCGSATILLEALELTQGNLNCIGMDVSRKAARGATENIRALFSDQQCKVHCCDARSLRKHVADESVDAIVTNVPWGIQTGHKQSVQDLQQLYEIVLRSSWYILKDGGRIVLLVLRGLQMTRLIRKLSGRYRLLLSVIVRTTNNLPCLIVLEKLGRDVVHDSIKGQLAYMSQFVNISKDLYHAIHMEQIDEGN